MTAMTDSDYLKRAVELADGWRILTSFGRDYI